MFQSRTLFVVGAGASKEAGLPTGAELKAKIANTIDIRFEGGFRQSRGDALVTQALRRHTADPQTNRHGDINPYLHAAWMIRDAMPQAISIDNFIDAHRNNDKLELVGKLGIVRCILEAERGSRLYFDQRNSQKLRFENLTDTWLDALLKLATETVSNGEVEQAFENVSFVTFNYDRCIEHFLVQWLRNYYGLDEAATQAVVQQVPIVHPYGQVGYLPWQPGSMKVAFGGNEYDRGDDLLAVSAQVKTFAERVENGIELQALRRRVQEAETIVFLGFAFHPQNMALIAPEEPARTKRIFGTAKGMSDSDTKAVTTDLAGWLKRKPQDVEIELRNRLTCHELFGEFWRSMPRAMA